MGRRLITAIIVLGVTLAATAAARPGIYEYWKAGTKRSRTKATLPTGRSRLVRREVTLPPASAPAVTPWTESWFANPVLVRARIAEMRAAITVPMIGQSFPLPRGGGFVCTRLEGSGAPTAGGLVRVIECAGSELGGRRQNQFYSGGANDPPTLDRVRWVILAPPSSPRERWRAFLHEAADSLSIPLGPATRSGVDSTDATWTSREFTTTMRLYGDPARVDSLEFECHSERLLAAHASGH